MKKIRSRWTLAWSMATLLILYGLHPGSAAAQELRVGTWKTAQTIQPFFYSEFLPEPGKVTVFPFTNPADQKTALLAGSLDMCGTTIAHAIHSAALGQPVVVVAALCNKSSALVVKNDGKIQSVADLKGKKIGYVPGTMHEILLRETLTRHRLSPEKDVALIRIDFFDMGLALARGGIDAFLSGEPFPTLAVQNGYGRILSYPYYGKSIGTINAGMLVTREMIEKNPETVYQLVKTHARATRHLMADQKAWLERAAAFGTPIDTLEAAAGNMELAWDMDDAFVGKVKALGQRMEALGIITRQPDYDALIDLTFVKRVRAEL
jgi:NitT/TauT family transport system substrate-binding protein